MGITGVVRPVQETKSDTGSIQYTQWQQMDTSKSTTSGSGDVKFKPYGTSSYPSKPASSYYLAALRKEAERKLAILKAEADRIAAEELAKRRKLATDILARESRIKRERELREIIRKAGVKRVRKLSSKQRINLQLKLQTILAKKLLVRKKRFTRKIKRKKIFYISEVRTTKKWRAIGKFKNLRKAKRIGKRIVLETPAISLRIKKNGKIIRLTAKASSKLFKISKKELGVLIERKPIKFTKKSITTKLKKSKVLRKRVALQGAMGGKGRISKPIKRAKRKPSSAQLKALAKGRAKLKSLRRRK